MWVCVCVCIFIGLPSCSTISGELCVVINGYISSINSTIIMLFSAIVSLFPLVLHEILVFKVFCLFFSYPAFIQYMFLCFFFFLVEAASFILVPVFIVSFHWYHSYSYLYVQCFLVIVFRQLALLWGIFPSLMSSQCLNFDFFLFLL